MPAKKILPFLFILFLYLPIHSQLIPDNWRCGVTSTLEAENFPFKPAKTPVFQRPFKILIVYVRFANDNALPRFDNFWWPPNEKPQRPPQVGGGSIIAELDVPFNPDFMNMYPEYTITDYFCEMSTGKLDVVGDEIMVNLPESDTYYRLSYQTRSAMNQHILEYWVDVVNDVDFQLYDNWDFNEGTSQWDYAPDGDVDMIVIVYRHLPNGAFWLMGDASGWSSLNCDLTLDGKNIVGNFGTSGSGVTTLGGLMNYSNVTGVIQHEICHYLFNGNVTNGYHGSSGLMTGLGEMSFCMNPHERSIPFLEWTGPTYISSTGIYEFTLPDYIKSGNSLNIQLPGISESFYVANSQRVSKYDGIMRGSKACWDINKNQQDPYCPAGKGLYIYHYALPSYTTYELCDPVPPYQQEYYVREFDLENAEGKYNWVKARDVNYYSPPPYFTIPLFEPIGRNVTGGKEETHHWIKLPNACMQKEVTDDPCNEANDLNDYIITIDDLGDEKDAFNYGYDEIFSPYSNPSTHSYFNPNLIVPLTICITGQDPNGDIHIKIYYNNETQALEDLPPSKPKNLKSSKHIINQQTGAFHPKLTWDANIEPDFNGSIGYRIYRGVLTTCTPNVEPSSYSLIATVGYDVTQYIDNTVTLYPPPSQPGENCEFRSYSYKIDAVDTDNKVSLKSDRAIINGYTNICWFDNPNSEENNIPSQFSIYNYPNPFNPSTEIKYDLPKSTLVTIKIYNNIGQVVATLVNNEYKNAGRYSITFDGTNLASGIYFYVIEAGIFRDSKKMVLIK